MTEQPVAKEKRCPGLKGIPCGNVLAEGKGGYCPDCRRRYQRSRYERVRAAAGFGYSARPSTRTDPARCACCGMHKEEGLIVLKSLRRICEKCWDFAAMVTNDFGPELFQRVAKYALDNPEDFGLLESKKFYTLNREEAIELEYQKRITERIEEFAFTGPNAYEECEEFTGADVRRMIERELENGTLRLKTEVSNIDAPWLFEQKIA